MNPRDEEITRFIDALKAHWLNNPDKPFGRLIYKLIERTPRLTTAHVDMASDLKFLADKDARAALLVSNLLAKRKRRGRTKAGTT